MLQKEWKFGCKQKRAREKLKRQHCEKTQQAIIRDYNNVCVYHYSLLVMFAAYHASMKHGTETIHIAPKCTSRG